MTDAPQILLAHHLKALKLPTFLREYDKVARLCAAEGVDHPRYLMRLAEMEMIDRERRMVDRRIKAARFPTVKSLDSFDFLALPSLNKMLVLELARSDYIERRENIIAVGNSGTFARAAQLQPRAIDNQVQFVGSISPVGVNRQTGPSPAQRRMIGNRQIDIQHAHD